MKTMIMKVSVSAACLTLAVDFAVAARVETIKVRSESMDKDVPVAVVLPDGYDPAKKYPVVYMTHGAGGDYKTMTMEDCLVQCDKYAFIGISPDGGKTSWWWDAPVDPTYRYETFFIKELMPFVEKKYSVDARRERRAIVGGSMGGHGACWLGFRHKDRFGAVGSIFGGVDIRPFPNDWDIAKRLGSLKGNEKVWAEHSAITEAAKLENGDVELCMMVGTKDFFLKVNRDMHDLLAKNGVEHYYIEYTTESPSTSGHCREFCTYAIPVMFTFFDNYFKTGSGQLQVGCRPHVGAAMMRAAVPTAKAEKRSGWDDEKFTMGAIRWDAWYGPGENFDTVWQEAVGTLQHPAHRWRLPFFTEIAADGKVTVDGRKPETMEREIDFAADGGLDYWAFLVYENGNSRNNALPLYLKARNRNRMRFCMALIIASRKNCDWPATRDRWLSHFDQPGYMRVCGGRELVFVYPKMVPPAYLDDFRRKAKERGHNPYFVGMTFARPAVRAKVAKECAGMDAVGAYNFVHHFEDYDKMMDFLEENQWNAAAKDGIVLVPSANAGFDASPRRDTEVSWQKGFFKGKTFHPPLTREQLMEATRRVKKFVLTNPTTCEAKTCLWYAWNEFDEGGWLCPTRKADGTPDTMRLEALKDALAE